MSEKSVTVESPGKKASRRFHVEQVPFLPRLVAGMMRFLHGSCHFSILGKEHEDAALAHDGPALFVSWHFAFPAVIYHFRDRNGMVMVSRSRDGEWAARVLKHLGYKSFRGSPGKGGATALRRIIAEIKRGPGGGFVADGSKGPPLVAQKGILLLARYTEAPLVPVSVAADPCWRFHSWDRTLLAKPFSRVVLAFGPPLWVPRNMSAEQMDRKRLELENTLNDLTRKAEEAL